MDKVRLFTSVVSISFLLSVIPVKKAIDNKIEKKVRKEVTIENVFNDFSYKLTPENKEKAQEIVYRLYNNKEVYEKLSSHSLFLSQSKDKLLLLMADGQRSSLDSATKILNLQKERFSKMVVDLNKNQAVSRNLDTLFNIFSTNHSFKNKFKIDLLSAQLSKNPLYIIDKGFLLKRKPTLDPRPASFDSRNRVLGFNSLQQRGVIPRNVATTPKAPVLKSSDTTNKLLPRRNVRRRPGR